MKQQSSRQEAGFRQGGNAQVDRRVRKVFARLAVAPGTAPRTLAREQNISVSWLGQLIKKETGATLRACIIRQRMEAAAHLLQTTELRIKEIAAQLGYAQTPSFVRIFRRAYGQSPQHYRRAMDAATAARPQYAALRATAPALYALCLQGGDPAAGWPSARVPQRKKLTQRRKG